MIPSHPSQIRLYWLEDDEFLSSYALLRRWTPFEASCLIHGLHPGRMRDGVVWVGREPNPKRGEGYEDDPDNRDLVRSVINHARIIRRNNDHSNEVPAQDVVRWGVENGLVERGSYLSRRLLGESIPSDATAPTYGELLRRCLDAESELERLKAEGGLKGKRGAHFADKRAAILGAAMRALVAEDRWEGVLRKGEIIAAVLAEQINDQRHRYALQEASSFSFSNIRDTISDALRRSRKPK